MGFQKKAGRTAIVMAAAASLLLSGCSTAASAPGGDDGAAIDDYMTYTLDELAEAAQDEGKLTLYSGRAESAVLKDVEAFNELYDIDVDVYRAANDEVQLRVLKEFQANRAGADVVDVTAPEMLEIDKAGAIAPFTADAAGGVMASADFGNWQAARFVVFAPAWNTDNVSASEAPTSWEELADAKWKGRLAVELTDYEWYYGLWNWFTQEDGKSEAEADALLKAIIDNSVIVKGHSAAAELLAAGQFDVFVTPYLDGIATLRTKGAPVEYSPVVEPLILKASGSAVMANAPHPAAAVLWVTWLLTDGQESVASTGGIVPGVEAYAPEEFAGKTTWVIDTPALSEVKDEWSQTFDDLVAGKDVVSD